MRPDDALESPAGRVAPFVRRVRPLARTAPADAAGAFETAPRLAAVRSRAAPLRVARDAFETAARLAAVRPRAAPLRVAKDVFETAARSAAADACDTVPRLVVARSPAALFAPRPAVRLPVTFLTSPANVKHFYFAMIAGRVAQFGT